MRNAVVANATDDDLTFAKGSQLWVIDGPRKRDGRVKVLGYGVEGGRLTRRRHPSELEGLRVEAFLSHQIPEDAVDWNPRLRPPDWIGGLSYATDRPSS